jgi:SAM-dependent methyltransferase
MRMLSLREQLQIAKGFASRIPGIRKSPKGGQAPSAPYSYDIWMKHLWHLWENGLRKMPETVVELGPGQSLGVGLAALLSGANAYYGLDSVPICNLNASENLLDKMMLLFLGRAGQQIKGWPAYGPEFPHHILSPSQLDTTLSPERIEDIASALKSVSLPTMRYIAPWEYRSIESASADLVLSHSVMQYFDDLRTAYTGMYKWLKPGGMISHQVEFSGMQFAENEWNSHWSHGEPMWRMIVGKRPGTINRLPFSAHVSTMESAGFEIVCSMIAKDQAGIPREALASQWVGLSDSDLHGRAGFVQARKPPR